MADERDLGSRAERRESSSLSFPTPDENKKAEAVPK